MIVVVEASTTECCSEATKMKSNEKTGIKVICGNKNQLDYKKYQRTFLLLHQVLFSTDCCLHSSFV